jgi:predicted nucleic acid-binding protein
MKYALDTSVLVAYFLPEDPWNEHATNLLQQILDGTIEYCCVSKINIAEAGYVLERATESRDYAINAMAAITGEFGLDVLDLTWDFMITLAHLKALNSIAFCDNATLAAGNLTKAQAIFSKEREIMQKSRNQIKGAKIVFLDEIVKK